MSPPEPVQSTLSSDLGELIGVSRLDAVLGRDAVEALGVVPRRRRPDAGDVRHRRRSLAARLLLRQRLQRLAERAGAGAPLQVDGGGGGGGGGRGAGTDDAGRRTAHIVARRCRRQVDVLLFVYT